MFLSSVRKCLVMVVLVHVLLAAADGDKTVCSSIKIRSIKDLNALEGKPSCQIINGSVDIRLNAAIKQFCATETSDYNKVMKVLSKVEEIRDYLTITQTPFLQDLSLLPELKKIKGSHLVDDKYSMVLTQNDNLRRLWIQNQSVIIDNGETLIDDTKSYLIAPEEKNTIDVDIKTNSRVALINWTLPVGVNCSESQNYLYTISYEEPGDHPDVCKRKVLTEKFIRLSLDKSLTVMIPHTPEETDYHFELQLMNLENKILASTFLQELELQPSSVTLQSSVSTDKTVEIAVKWTQEDFDHHTIDRYEVTAFHIPSDATASHVIDEIEPFDFELMKDEIKEKFVKELWSESYDSSNIGREFLKATVDKSSLLYSFKDVAPSAQYYVSVKACSGSGSTVWCSNPETNTITTMKP